MCRILSFRDRHTLLLPVSMLVGDTKTEAPAKIDGLEGCLACVSCALRRSTWNKRLLRNRSGSEADKSASFIIKTPFLLLILFLVHFAQASLLLERQKNFMYQDSSSCRCLLQEDS